MPTKRRFQTRKPTGGPAEIEAAAAYFRFGYLLAGQQNFGTGKSKRELLDFWNRHRREILAANSRQCEALKKPFVRPWPFMAETEKAHPRLQVGVVEWWPPWAGGGPPTKPESEAEFENDQEFLTRLNLLEPWEVELLKKRKENGNLQEKENANIDKTATA